MRCPKCDSESTHVSNTRPRKVKPRESPAIRRRRVCYSCRHVWHTVEQLAASNGARLE